MIRTAAGCADLGGRISSHANKESCDAFLFYPEPIVVTEHLRLLEPGELAEVGPAVTAGLPLDVVDPNPSNPRKELLEIGALADNIKTFGLLQPVTVRRIGERYELLGGHRRRAAYLLLREREPHNPQWRTIDAVIRTADDDRAYLMLISGQVHNRAWRPREEASALERLAVAGLSLSEIGQRLSRSESWASTRLRIYSDSVLSGYVQTGRLPPGVAQELLLVKDAGSRADLAERAAIEHWGLDKARAEVRRLRIDRGLSQANRLTRSLLELLSSVTPQQVPLDLQRDLWTLHGRIEVLGRGEPRKVPTIEEAQKVAGVRTQERPLRRGERRKPGYKPKV